MGQWPGLALVNTVQSPDALLWLSPWPAIPTTAWTGAWYSGLSEGARQAFLYTCFGRLDMWKRKEISEAIDYS